VFWMQGKPRRAHRVAYLIANGCWPEPCCLHACDTPRCVNPKHLSAGTYAENNADMVAKGRQGRGDSPARAAKRRYGEEHHAARLTAEVVAELRTRYGAGESISSLSRWSGVTRRTVRQAVLGETWVEVGPREMAA
jgi:hypothetical protein